MIAFVAGAWAHPSGGHPVLHALEWRVRAGETTIRYEVEVPAALVRTGAGLSGFRDELVAGLKLETDGETTAVALVADQVKPTDHGAYFTLDLSAPLPPGTHTLELSNGNLPEATGLHRTTLTLGPDVDLLQTSLLVEHERAIVRSDSGRTRAATAARVTTATVHTPTNPLESLHRSLQGRQVRDPSTAILAPLHRSNRTTAALAAFIPALALLGVAAPRWPERPVWLGLAAIIALDFATPDGMSAILVAVAAAAAVLGLRRPSSLWLVAPALAASLDLRGVSVPVIALQLLLVGRLDSPMARRVTLAATALLCAIQAFRLL